MLKEGAPADMRARFEREAKVSMKIQHENAMVTYDFSEHNGQLYLVLEYLEGQSLRVWMNSRIRPMKNSGPRCRLRGRLNICTRSTWFIAI